MKFNIKNRFWIEGELGPFLGYGRVELLQKIDEYGSINQAAIAMNMAYRQAWGLVKSMNEKAQKPLVTKQIGGKGGGGTIVTPEGHKAILVFKQIENDFQQFIELESAKISKSFLEF